MKIKLLIITVLCLSLQTSNAQWWSNGTKVEGNGKIETEKRSVGSYDEVNLSGFFDVILEKDTEGNLTVEAESNLLDYITTVVEKGALKISTKKGFSLRTSKRMQIKITVPFEDLDKVALSGSGDIVGKDLIKAKNFKAYISGSGDVSLTIEAKDIETALSGSGDITLSGTTDKLTAKVSGSGDVSCYDLKANDVEAKVNGSGDLEVYASKSLYARVSGSGDIDYKGNPAKVDKKTSGSGDVTAH
jgi:hypothetical protein